MWHVSCAPFLVTWRFIVATVTCRKLQVLRRSRKEPIGEVKLVNFGAMHCPHIIEKVTGKREKDRKKIRATAKVHLKSHNLMADR